jgi:hypothetical protein
MYIVAGAVEAARDKLLKRNEQEKVARRSPEVG